MYNCETLKPNLMNIVACLAVICIANLDLTEEIPRGTSLRGFGKNPH
jgi:hypothetical protein